MNIPARSLVKFSSLFIGNSRVLSPLCASNLDSRAWELGGHTLIYSRLIGWSSVRDLSDAGDMSTHQNQTAWKYRSWLGTS
jgi:hypothetical protein